MVLRVYFFAFWHNILVPRTRCCAVWYHFSFSLHPSTRPFWYLFANFSLLGTCVAEKNGTFYLLFLLLVPFSLFFRLFTACKMVPRGYYFAFWYNLLVLHTHFLLFRYHFSFPLWSCNRSISQLPIQYLCFPQAVKVAVCKYLFHSVPFADSKASLRRIPRI